MNKKILQVSLVGLVLFGLISVQWVQSSPKTADRQALSESMSGIRMEDLRGKNVKAADFRLYDISGSELRLSDLRGKLILLNFFATWCASCVWEMAEMETLYKAYKDRGFTILAVSLDFAGPEKVRKFAADRNLTFPIVMDSDRLAAKEYGLRGPPLSYLIDPDGMIVGGVTGPTSWAGQDAFKVVEHFLNINGDSMK